MVKLMKSLSDIYSLIEDENIALEEVCFKSSNIEGMYFKVSGINPIIGIHKKLLVDTKIYIYISLRTWSSLYFLKKFNF